MVAAQQQDTHNTNGSLHVSISLRPSTSNVGNTILSADSSLLYDTSVSHVSFSGLDISESNQTLAGQEVLLPESSISPGFNNGAPGVR